MPTIRFFLKSCLLLFLIILFPTLLILQSTWNHDIRVRQRFSRYLLFYDNNESMESVTPQTSMVNFGHWDLMVYPDAYIDRRIANKSLIKFVAAKTWPNKTNVECVLTKDKLEIRIDAEYLYLGRYKRQRPSHSGFYHEYLMCPLPPDVEKFLLEENLTTIQLRYNNSVLSTPIPLTRLYNNNERPLPHNLTLCLPSLYKYSNWLQAITFFEYYKLLGVEKFNLYLHSVSEHVEKVLRYYEAVEEILEILPWKYPNHDKHGYYLQVMSMNHCMLRNIGVAKYTVILDLDEFLYINNQEKFLKLVPELDKINSAGVGGIQFRASFMKKSDGLKSITLKICNRKTFLIFSSM